MSVGQRLTMADFDRMIAEGYFDDPTRNQRIELIDGELREMTPPNPPHDESIDRLTEWSTRPGLRERIRVRVQNSLGIPELDCVPLPDLAWVRRRSYRRRRPEPRDVLLLVEVSESMLRYDRGLKAGIYATVGIQDYWVVNLVDEVIEVFRQPENGAYQQHTIFRRGESIVPLAFPDVSFPVALLFDDSDDSE